MTYLPSPSATFNFTLAPVFRAGALIQDETFAASATITADLTLRCFEFLARLVCSVDHGDAVEVLSDFVETELEEYPKEVARLCEAGSRTLSHAAELCRDVAAGQVSEAEAETVV
ncbi:hypothetical protein ACC786_32625 [Rhizobium ruizarguesonis]|uniref:hypothetical protein n=1 Tax=Rhizobium leguminosarum TaxID=384 RepID=UPI00103B5B76|nr:hypothetical protein [Rhizobium leguminosarum]MBY5494276.1 hypothetical protein [Rhizobium leguminosarum]TBZ40437.1 hypothetical protein E0H44_24365 [Rhizobium leguminosarum bv. viciae]TCA06413.1 hypothetical protein E0H68_31015 [Rhizobium leguminosarum bv. viciae]TCA19621.1 hypothetical protein E0H67_25795 [Rhizobium leguminosarum bv. viciae]